MNNELTKKQKEELQLLVDEITKEAKDLVLDYEKNITEISGSEIHIHENSPYLDSDDNDEPLFSGSRWEKVLKSF